MMSDFRLVDHQLPKYFKPEHVSETARETCRNWMYKIASVRELLPRIYVEMAVIKSYSFLENTCDTSKHCSGLSS